MELEGILAVIIGIILRFGLPLLITALIVVALKKVDASWQAEIDERRIQSLQGMEIEQVQCWTISSCPEIKREECVAYQIPSVPCWQHFRNGRGELREGCLECEIFRITPITIAA